MADIKVGLHDVFVTSSPSGWTNNDVGLAWLEQVFDRCTKKKARNGRDWRLLILDGHGSHLTEDFLHYCLTQMAKCTVYMVDFFVRDRSYAYGGDIREPGV